MGVPYVVVSVRQMSAYFASQQFTDVPSCEA
jgi:hypothetical protein